MEDKPFISTHPEPLSPEAQTTPPSAALDQQPARVLIIEDEEAHFTLMERAIRKELSHAHVCHAASAEACLEEFDRIAPDIILVDFLMPGMTGLEFLAHIKQMEVDIPVIMTTGQGDEHIAVQAMKLGAQDYLVKGADFFSLLPVVVEQAVRERAMKLHLKKVSRLNELLFDSLPYPAIMINRQRVILAANRIAQQYGAQAGKSCVSCRQHFSNATPANPSGICSYCRADDAFDQNEAINSPEVPLEDHYFDMWWIPIDGDVCLSYAIDITQRKRVEEQLRQNEASLVERTQLAEQRSVYIQQLAMELSKAEDRERQRLASILHDDFQQMLAYLKLQLSILPGGDQNDDLLQVLNKEIGDCIDRCRNLSHELKPFSSSQTDFPGALRLLCQRMMKMYGLEISLQIPDDAEIKSSVLCSLLVRSIRELLFNIVKHSKAATASIRVQLDGSQMQIVIKDEGRGCDPVQLKKKRENNEAFGLFDIEDRIQFLGGRMHIETERGKGFCVRLWVPSDIFCLSELTRPMSSPAPSHPV